MPTRAMTATKSKTAASKTAKVPEAKRYAWAGEILDIVEDSEVKAANKLLREYRAQASKLAVAKAAAFKAEDALKELMQGHETLRINGEQVATWKWADASEFDKDSAERDPFFGAYNQFRLRFTYTVKDKTRRFLCKGVVGVD